MNPSYDTHSPRPDAPGAKPEPTWISGPAGGGWLSMNQAIAAHIESLEPGLKLAVAAGGGRENPAAVGRGQAQFGTSVDFLAAAAFHGRAPYTSAHARLATLGTGWSRLPFHFVHAAAAEPDLAALLRGGRPRIAIPPKETSDELTFQHVLALYGTGYEALRASGGVFVHGSYDEIARVFAAGEVDHVFGATTMPAEVIAKLGHAPGRGRLASLPDTLLAHLSAGLGYGQCTIPADTYPSMQAGPVRTASMDTSFLVSTDVSDEIVYRVTRALLSPSRPLRSVHPSLARFVPDADAALPVPLHPGAARAWREFG